MKILSIRSISGPNVYHQLPVLVADIRLEKFAGAKSEEVERCYDRITSLLPGLKKEMCPPSLAHMIEEIVLELSQLSGIGVNFGRTFYGGEKGAYNVIVRSVNEEGMKYLLNSAVEIVQYALEGMRFDLDACLKHARYLISKSDPGLLASAALSSAKAKNIPWKILGTEGLIQFGHGKFRQLFQSGETERTSEIATSLVRKKSLFKKMLKEAAIMLSEEKTHYSLLIVGGKVVNVDENVRPEIKVKCERASRILGLDICGVDLDQKDEIVEMRFGKDMRTEDFSGAGKKSDLGDAIINYLFPYQINGRIPIASITGTNGKTMVGDLLAHVAGQGGTCVGRTSGDLMDTMTEMVVLENSRSEILKNGLGYDWSDIGIIADVKLDHIGEEIVESIEDVFKISTLLADRVRSGGTIILNADSPELVRFRDENREELSDRNIVYFSLYSSNRAVIDHLEDGGHAYFIRNGEIIEALGDDESIVFNVEQIPFTLNGTAMFQVANVLTAVAGGHALGFDDETILTGLLSFGREKIKGRTNLFHIGEGYLLTDYGHSPDTIMSIGEMGRKWDVTKLTAILTAPVKRSDEMIKLMGTAAAWVFDKIIVRDPLMAEAASDETPEIQCEVCKDGREALRSAVSQMQAKELIVYFYEDYKEVETLLSEFSVVPMELSEDTFFHKYASYSSESNEEWPQYSS